MPPLSTVLTFGFADFDPPRILALYAEMGCRVGQYYRNPNNQPKLKDVKSISDDAGLEIDSIHGVFGDTYDPSSPDESVRRFAMETYRAEAGIAAELGGPMVVVHPSPLLIEKPTDLVTCVAHDAPLRRSMEELARIGEEMGVVFLMENLPPNSWIGSDSLALGEMIRAVESKYLRMCFDVGHAYIGGSISPQLAGCGDVIDFLHIHDNDGEVDSHLMPGDGHIDWNSVGAGITEAQLETPMMLEVFYSDDRLVSEIANGIGERLAGWLPISQD